MRLRHRVGIVDALGELERVLDVLAGSDPVALVVVAAGAPLVDERAQTVARKAGALGELQRLGEERHRGPDRGELVAARAETEEDVGAVDVGESGALGDLARALEERDGLAHLAEVHARPAFSAEGPQLELGRRDRGERLAELRQDRQHLGVLVRLEGGLRTRSTLSTRSCSLEETPVSRKVGSTPSRAAIHSIVSPVGRVFPRSIWLRYSLEKRSPASSVWVRPRATRSWRTRSPRAERGERRLAAVSWSGMAFLVNYDRKKLPHKGT